MDGATPVDRQLAPPGGWIDAGELRIEPLPPEHMRPWERALAWALMKFGAPRSANAGIPLLFSVLLRHRRLFWPWMRFASRLMPGSSLDRREAELVILRVAWNCRCRYEWGQHVAIGLFAGLDDRDIARVAQGPEAAGWTPRQAALLQATDEFCHDGVISGRGWHRLAQQHGNEQLIEIGFLIGHYQMLAGVINSLALPLDPDAERLLACAAIHGI